VRQKEAFGLGHAVLRARNWWARAFAVVLADDVIEAETPVSASFWTCTFFSAPVLAIMEVPAENIARTGVIDAEPVAYNGGRDRVYRIRDWWRSPSRLKPLKPGHHRALRADAGDFRFHSNYRTRLRGNPAHGRLEHLLRQRRYTAIVRGHALRRGDKLGF